MISNLSFLLANNLYGYSMSKPLPYGDYSWVNESEFNKFNWEILNEDDKFGYILEVDLLYLNYLHNFHSDYPLAPVKRKVRYEQLNL